MKIHSKFIDFYDWCASVYYDEDTFYERKHDKYYGYNIPQTLEKSLENHVSNNFFQKESNVFDKKSLNRKDRAEVQTKNSTNLYIEQINKGMLLIGDKLSIPFFSIGLHKAFEPDPIKDSVYRRTKKMEKELKELPGYISYHNDVMPCFEGFVFTDPTELLAFLDKHTTFSVPKNINKNSMKSFLDLKRPENQLINEIRAHFEEPVLLIHSTVIYNDFEIFTNPSLSEIGAGKILDPIKVFQEINMFIRSKKEPKNMVQIGDKDLMFGKGFNNQSFKKEPNKPKRKNKNINKP